LCQEREAEASCKNCFRMEFFETIEEAVSVCAPENFPVLRVPGQN
jgi:hypothetical protein